MAVTRRGFFRRLTTGLGAIYIDRNVCHAGTPPAAFLKIDSKAGQRYRIWPDDSGNGGFTWL